MGKRKNVTAPQNYVVERVLDRYLDDLGNKWFQLKWLGFPAEQATWEPESNVDCTSLVKQFEDGLQKPKLVLKKKVKKQGAAEEEEEWSLKQSGTGGSSTKIVLKKVNLGKTEICSRGYDQAHLFSSPTNRVSEPTPCDLPGRHSKRRRSSTIGVEVAPKKKRTGRKKKSTVDPVAAESTEEYMVEAILDKCLGANGVILYHIKWIGFDHIYNTWEPVENLNCPQILHAFNQRCKQPKVTVSKILDKRRVEDRIEYLVKISGCRKDTWMFETELHCTDLLDAFNRTYRAKQTKVSLADIADDYVSDSEELATNSTKGVKINKECETSSDDSVNFSLLLPKKKKPLQNGKVRAKSRSKSPTVSSSGSGTDSDDFGDLLKKINKSVEEDNLDSAPPSPPEEMVSPVKQEPGRSDKVIPETVKKLARLKNGQSPTPEADSFHVVKKEEFVIKKPSSPPSSAPIAPPTEISPPQSQELVKPASSPVVSDEDEKKVPLTTYTPFLPDLIIPARSPIRKPPSRESPRREVSPPPVYGYPGSLTSDRTRDPSKPEYTPTKPYNSLSSYLRPSQSASEDSDSDESLSELENNLTKALKEEPSGPPNQPFSGVDLGALLLTEADKTADTSMSGLLDTIVSQTVTNSLHTAFLDTSVLDTRDISHSELFAVVAQHTLQPSEKDIDFMLGDLYETASSSKETSKCESDGEREDGFCSPTADFVSDDEETEPLDPPLNSILSLGPGNSAPPRPPPKEPKKQRSTPPKKVDPPFTAFSGLLSTFAKPSKRPKKAEKPTKAEKPVKLEKTEKPVKSVKPVRTFSKKTPKTNNKPTSIFTDDIFSDIGSLSSLTKKSYATTSSPCPFCARKFKDRTKLDFHISNKHPQMLEMHCEGCGEFFQSAIEYQCHQMTGCGNDEG